MLIWRTRNSLIALKFGVALFLVLVFAGFCNGCAKIVPLDVSFAQSASMVQAYDFVEVTASVSWPRAKNAFTDAAFSGWFESSDGSKRWPVEGFCDSEDGSMFRIRFMPPAAGDYRYFVEYRQNHTSKVSTGKFYASDGHRRGPIRVDPQYRWHFIWEGTGEHYFFNGTTAFWLMGWKDDNVIQSAIERLHKLKINRLRVTIAGRSNLFYGEPVMNGPNWTLFITPWPAEHAEDVFHPGFDYQRFDVSYWQKLDRALRYARDRDMIISLVLDMNDGRAHPGAGSADEYRFIHYAIDRFGAYSNITWDLGDDLDGYRGRWWTHHTGTLIENWDRYHHLATSHPLRNIHQDRTSDWFGFTSFQEWWTNQHSFMLRERKEQEETGRIIPQTNEEYGYEDSLVTWEPPWPGESADILRRTAWGISMAGGYQTTGETAKRGTNVWPDTGGGWMNGRGDDSMNMLKGYEHMIDFFTSFEWWKMDPHDELVTEGDYCLAETGKTYAIYLPKGGSVHVKLQPGNYTASWFNAMTGEWINLRNIQVGASWTSPLSPGVGDWALLLRRVSA
jgi:Protein of unknown function (DUF4038)/Domain of unknown function (DUF5060)/Putative collagen-binding domain of a collagenase